MEIRKLNKHHLTQIIDVLGNGKKISKKDSQIVKSYFTKKWIGYGMFVQINPTTAEDKLIAYCFVKNPKSRPETMTVVHIDYRNMGIATELRDYAISRHEFIGHIIYSAVKLDNPSSFKSILKSNFNVFDVTKDGYIQLIKILYKN
jgi:hypothetical protein